MIGDVAVGKSSLINRAIKRSFKSAYSPTLGFDYFSYYIKIKNKVLKLKLWDTGGQEIYQSLVTNFYRNSSFAFMVYAINNRDSFENIDTWLKEIKYKSNPDIKIFLIGNKCDLTEERKVTYAEGKTYCNNYKKYHG
jgi:small GTP-binding protein